MLRVESLQVDYGGKLVLRGISLDAAPGHIVGIIGPNGAGKSTLLKAIYGLIQIRAGRVLLNEREVTSRRPSDNVRSGVVYVPQGMRVFANLTALENVLLGAYWTRDRRAVRARLAEVLDLLPALRVKQRNLAASLSGGEQQMTAIARALMSSPKVMLIDEPSLGLSASVTAEIMDALLELARHQEATVLIVEQNVKEVVRIANRIVVLKEGVIAHEAHADVFQDTSWVLASFFA